MCQKSQRKDLNKTKQKTTPPSPIKKKKKNIPTHRALNIRMVVVHVVDVDGDHGGDGVQAVPALVHGVGIERHRPPVGGLAVQALGIGRDWA